MRTAATRSVCRVSRILDVLTAKAGLTSLPAQSIQPTIAGIRTISATGLVIDVIAGARPNFMKIASVLRAVKARQQAGSKLRLLAPSSAYLRR